MAKTIIDLSRVEANFPPKGDLELETELALLANSNATDALVKLYQRLLFNLDITPSCLTILYNFVIQSPSKQILNRSVIDTLIICLLKAPVKLDDERLRRLSLEISEPQLTEVIIALDALCCDEPEHYRIKFDALFLILICTTPDKIFQSGNSKISNLIMSKRLHSSEESEQESDFLLRNLLANWSQYNWQDNHFHDLVLNKLIAVFIKLDVPALALFFKPILTPSTAFIIFFDSLIQRAFTDEVSGKVLRLISGGDSHYQDPGLIAYFLLNNTTKNPFLIANFLKRLDLKMQLSIGKPYLKSFHSNQAEDEALRNIYIEILHQKLLKIDQETFKEKIFESINQSLHNSQPAQEILSESIRELADIIIDVKNNRSKIVQEFFLLFDDSLRLSLHLVRELWLKDYTQKELMKPLRRVVKELNGSGGLKFLQEFEPSLIKKFYDYLLFSNAEPKEFELYITLSREKGQENLLVELLQETQNAPKEFFDKAMDEISNNGLLHLLNILLVKSDNQIAFKGQLTQTLIAFCDKNIKKNLDPVEIIKMSGFLPYEINNLMIALLKTPQCFELLTRVPILKTVINSVMSTVNIYLNRNLSSFHTEFKPAPIFNLNLMDEETIEKIALNLLIFFQTDPPRLRKIFLDLEKSKLHHNATGVENYRSFKTACWDILTNNAPYKDNETCTLFLTEKMENFSLFHRYLLDKLLSNNPDVSLGIQYIACMPSIPVDSVIPKLFLVRVLLKSQDELTKDNWNKVAAFMSEWKWQDAVGFVSELIRQLDAISNNPILVTEGLNFITKSSHFPSLLHELDQSSIEWLLKTSHPEIIEQTFLNWLAQFSSRSDINFSAILNILPKKESFLTSVFISLTPYLYEIFNQVTAHFPENSLYVALLHAQILKGTDEEKHQFIASIHNHWIERNVPFPIANFLSSVLFSIQAFNLTDRKDRHIFFEQLKFVWKIENIEQRNEALRSLIPLLFTHKDLKLDKSIENDDFQAILQSIITNPTFQFTEENLIYLFHFLSLKNQKIFAIQMLENGELETVPSKFLKTLTLELEITELYHYYKESNAKNLVVLIVQHRDGLSLLEDDEQADILQQITTDQQITAVFSEASLECTRLDFVSCLFVYLNKANKSIGKWLAELQLSDANLARFGNFTIEPENKRQLDEAFKNELSTDGVNDFLRNPEKNMRILQNSWLYTCLRKNWCTVLDFQQPHRDTFSYLVAEDAVEALINQTQLLMETYRLDTFYQPLAGSDPACRLIASRWIHRLPLFSMLLSILREQDENEELRPYIEATNLFGNFHQLYEDATEFEFINFFINELPNLLLIYLEEFEDKQSLHFRQLKQVWDQYQLQHLAIEKYSPGLDCFINDNIGLAKIDKTGNIKQLIRQDVDKLERATDHLQATQLTPQAELAVLVTSALKINGVFENQRFQNWLFDLCLFSPLAENLNSQSLLQKLNPAVFTKKMLALESKLQKFQEIYKALMAVPDSATVAEFLQGFAADSAEAMLRVGHLDPMIKGLSASEEEIESILEALRFAHLPHLSLFYQFLLEAKRSKLPEAALLRLTLGDLCHNYEMVWIKNEIQQLTPTFFQILDRRCQDLIYLQFNYANDKQNVERLRWIGKFLTEKNTSIVAACLSSFLPAIKADPSYINHVLKLFEKQLSKAQRFPDFLLKLAPALVDKIISALIEQETINKPLLNLFIENGFTNSCLSKLKLRMQKQIKAAMPDYEEVPSTLKDLPLTKLCECSAANCLLLLQTQHLIYHLVPIFNFWPDKEQNLSLNSPEATLAADASLLDTISLFDPHLEYFIRSETGKENSEVFCFQDFCFDYLHQTNGFKSYGLYSVTNLDTHPVLRLHIAKLTAFFHKDPKSLLEVFINWIEKPKTFEQHEVSLLKHFFKIILVLIPAKTINLNLHLNKKVLNGLFILLEKWQLNPNILLPIFNQVREEDLGRYIALHLMLRNDYISKLKSESFLNALTNSTTAQESRLKPLIHYIHLELIPLEILRKLDIEVAASFFCSVKHFAELTEERMEILLERMVPALNFILPYWFSHALQLPNAIIPLCSVINMYPDEFIKHFTTIPLLYQQNLLTQLIDNAHRLKSLHKKCASLVETANEAHFFKAINLFLQDRQNSCLRDLIIHISLKIIEANIPLSKLSLRTLVTISEMDEFSPLKVALRKVDKQIEGFVNLFNNCDIFYDNHRPNIERMKNPLYSDSEEETNFEKFKYILGVKKKAKRNPFDVEEPAIDYVIKRYTGDLVELTICIEDYLHSFYKDPDVLRLAKTASLLNEPSINIIIRNNLFDVFLANSELWVSDPKTAIALLQFDATRVIKFLGKNKNYEQLIDFYQSVYFEIKKYPDLYSILNKAYEEAILEADLRDDTSCFRGITAWFNRCFTYGWTGFFSANDPSFVQPFDDLSIDNSTQIMLKDFSSLSKKEKEQPTFDILLAEKPNPMKKSWLRKLYKALQQEEWKYPAQDTKEADLREEIEALFQALLNKNHGPTIDSWFKKHRDMFEKNRERLIAIYALNKAMEPLGNLLSQIKYTNLQQAFFEVGEPEFVDLTKSQEIQDKGKDKCKESNNLPFSLLFDSISLETTTQRILSSFSFN